MNYEIKVKLISYFLHKKSRRFPFDWQNPTGFLAAFLLIYIFQLNVMVLITYGLAFEICLYKLITSFTEDIKSDLFALNEIVKSGLHPAKLFKQLFEFIEFHSAVKRFKLKRTSKHIFEHFKVKKNSAYRYLSNWSKFSQPVFMVAVVINIVTICVTLLSMQIELVSCGSLGAWTTFAVPSMSRGGSFPLSLEN